MNPKLMHEFIVILLIVKVDKISNDVNKGNTTTFPYKGEPIKVMQSFKFLDVIVPNRWNVNYESRLQVGWNSYYVCENQCNKINT